MRRISFAGLVVLGASAPLFAEQTCQALNSLALEHAPITSAADVPEGPVPGARGGSPAVAPAHCAVQGIIRPTKDSEIHFELWLPATGWNGKYLQIGSGGWAGTINAAGLIEPLKRGYATAATDDGHQGGAGATWAIGHPEKLIDFGYRAVHETNLQAKAIIRAFYGRAPSRSYFNGCSDGGREALMEAQRYAEDFDGIIAGAPEIYAAPLNGEEQAWNARVNLDAQGREILTADKLPALHAAVMAACDGRDGLVDGQIDDPRQCDFDPGSIQCPAGVDLPTCLTPAQVGVVRKFYQGVVDDHGRHLYPGGLPYGSELGWVPFAVSATPGVLPLDASLADNYLRFQAFPAGKPGPSFRDWQFTLDGFKRLLPEARVYDALDADLT